MYSINDYNYELPEPLVAQHPSGRRDMSRLLYLEKETGSVSHQIFGDLESHLNAGDVMVINNTRVIPGRLTGKKNTGGKIEVLLLDFAGACSRQKAPGTFICDCLVKSSKPSRPGTTFIFDHDLEAEVLDGKEGIYTLKFSYPGNFEDIMFRIGHVPLPPYIKRDENAGSREDIESYQTVYAKEKGAIAAPTAGLHFTAPLLDRIRENGVEITSITLHVGYGTFLPVRVTDIREHRMHSEYFTISTDTADIINRAKNENRRVVAVGTTSVRTLEYSAGEDGRITSGTGSCNLFIYPGYSFKIVDAMLTNFHLPKSTLLMLVSAFAGRNKILNAYETAVENRYRFFSYGDAMFIA
ncbi:MAG: tRNA preQ1(34) S-adenosylmethionine ribosyltransferase-isomerase QueA [Desulfobacterales bacterium]|nr:tRNA preQ1(34) S-adenosylmethionine ribosyltransferase-isomerase QueA [Desulfobacterales bacterium]